MNISVHRFAGLEAAANAMGYFSDYVTTEHGLQEVEAPAIGESARMLVGAPDGVPLAVLYAQQGPIMYRIGGSSSSEESDPTVDVLAAARQILPTRDQEEDGSDASTAAQATVAAQATQIAVFEESQVQAAATATALAVVATENATSGANALATAQAGAAAARARPRWRFLQDPTGPWVEMSA